MATKNGACYVKEQLDSILLQLSPQDELVISDDSSTDNTVAIVQGYSDARIKLIRNTEKGIIKNFESALNASRGDLIFLTDQDDVWMDTKIRIMTNHLKHYDLVTSDCLLTDHSLKSTNPSFFRMNNSGKGLLKNILKNSYMGCCMAFNRNLLDRALPFPNDIPAHDYWIGLVGELYFKVHFIPEVLVFHRRHAANASTTGRVSEQKFSTRFINRYRIVKNLFLHKPYAA